MPPKFPSKPPAPSVKETIGPAIQRSRWLSKNDRPMSREEIVEDVIRSVNLPESVKRALRRSD